MIDVKNFSDNENYYKAMINEGFFVVLQKNQNFSEEVF